MTSNKPTLSLKNCVANWLKLSLVSLHLFILEFLNRFYLFLWIYGLLSSDADQAQTKVNGESTSEKKDDSGNETGVEINEPEEEDTGFYDKAKSFFDNISCEAVERSKG